MLNESFYHIETEHNTDSFWQYRLSLNTEHEVFKGHFPNQPVVPGVFTTQIIHELTEKIAGKKLRLTSARKIKFLYMINPQLGNILEVKLTVKPDNDLLAVDATAEFMNQPCFKINAKYAGL